MVGGSSSRRLESPELGEVLGFDATTPTRTVGQGPSGSLPLTEQMLRTEPSGTLFGLTQNVGMGWEPSESNNPAFLVLSTHGGLSTDDGTPVALGYHTGHWEVHRQVRAAAETLKELGCVPFAGYCTDPCDGRSQGTPGMMDSLPYRNDAAIVLRRLARSLPTRSGHLGVATCDKGLPAMMLALAGLGAQPGVIVPGGVTLPVEGAEDTALVQTIGARFSHGMISLEHAAEMGCKACGSPGGGCQFLGTAATAQVVAEACGMALPHAALAPSGQEVWLEVARRSARAVVRQALAGITMADVLTDASLRNAMVVHAAFGGSTNLLLHIPALAHAAGLTVPTVEDWSSINRETPRLVDALPNGPVGHATIWVYMAGGVPEVMLHLRALGLLDTSVQTAAGVSLDEALDGWQESPRRDTFRDIASGDGVDPDDVIMSPDSARSRGMTSTVVFPVGNVAPTGSVIKATAIDPSVVDDDGVYRHRGPVKVFTSEAQAIDAIKGVGTRRIEEHDILVFAGGGPAGTGMEETYQLTAALKYLPFGKTVTLITDARFSGVSTGACIGHVGPEALAGGPIGKLRDGDLLEVEIDRNRLTGRIDFVGSAAESLDAGAAAKELEGRPLHPDVAPHPDLPEDTRLWAALQAVSGGTWGGCVYDPDRIIDALNSRTERPVATSP